MRQSESAAAGSIAATNEDDIMDPAYLFPLDPDGELLPDQPPDVRHVPHADLPPPPPQAVAAGCDRSTLGTMQLLAEWASQPAPPTMVHVPRRLRRRFAAIAMQLFRRATHLSVSVDADPAQKEPAIYYMLLWSFPSLVLRVDPYHPETEMEHNARNLRLAASARECLQHAEAGEWHLLLQAALSERDKLAEEQASRDAFAPQLEPSWLQRLGQAARKTRNGCLRTATHILVGPGKAPPTVETAEATWALACRAPGPHDAEAYAEARRAAQRASAVKVTQRIVTKRIRLACAGAEPGPSGWRNGHLACMHDDAPDGPRALVEWTQLWIDGVPALAGAVWRQACLVSLAKPGGGVRPLMLQETPLKLTENVLVAVHQEALIAAVGPTQFGVGPQSRSHVASALIEGATKDTDVDGLLSVDCSNAFGSIFHAAIYWSLIHAYPGILAYLLCFWHDAGILIWQKVDNHWEYRHCQRGVPQGSPLAPWLYAIALYHLLYVNERAIPVALAARWGAMRQAFLKAQLLMYVDDISCWGRHGSIVDAWIFMSPALLVGGLEVKPSKSQLWLRSGPHSRLPGVDVEPAACITALGCSLHTDCEIQVGAQPDHDAVLAIDAASPL